jgi:hypothetical protein
MFFDGVVETTEKNPGTLARYEAAIKGRMESPTIVEQCTYGFLNDSKVFFNSSTNNVVFLDGSGNYLTGFKLSPRTKQFDNSVNYGVLR